MTDREVFRKNLTNLMNETKVKQIDIAKYAEVSYQTVSAWICGRGYPRADAMERLCRFFGVKQSVLTESHEQQETDESKLVIKFRSMSDEGKSRLLERADELVKLYPKRRKRNAETETKV